MLADAATYEEKYKALLTESLKKQAEVNGKLAEVEEKWLEINEEIETLSRDVQLNV